MAEAKQVRHIDPVEATRRLLPALRPGYVAEAATEDDAFDMDVAALHAGFLRQHRAHGGMPSRCATAPAASSAQGDRWSVETSSGATFRAPVLVNAAGAWGDEVAIPSRNPPARARAQAPHRLHHRPGAMAGRGLAVRLRRFGGEWYCPAGGPHPA